MRLPTTKTIFLILCLFSYLIASTNTSQAGQEAQLSFLKQGGHLSLVITLSDGFKTYWKYPGNGGYAPKVIWREDSLPLVFPAPERLSILGYDSLGFKKKVVLPILLPLEEIEGQKKLALDIDIPVCNERICIPFRKTLTTPDLTGIKNPSRTIATIPSLSVPILSLHEGQLSVSLQFKKPQAFDDIIISLASEPFLPPFPKPLITTINGQTQQQIAHAAITLPASFRFQQQPDIHVLLKTKTSQASAFFPQPPPANLKIAPSQNATNNTLESTLWITLIFAFLGGLLVNVMPCVIPLIGLKLGTNWQFAPQEKRRYFLYQAAGIFTSFAVLAAIFVGSSYILDIPLWGRQLQSPLAIVLIGLFLIFFTLLLISPTSIHPRFSLYFHHNTRLRPFASGMLIPIIAAPCSAPFIATSLASALLSPSPLYAALIFTSLGSGIACPSVIIALLYRVQIPTPPHNIVRAIKITVYALLIAFILWLVWLSSQIHSILLAAVFMASLVTIAFVMLIPLKTKLRYLSITATTALLIASSTLLSPSKPLNNAFSEDFISHLLNRNIPVLVTVSAQWCITCKVNDFVLESSPVQAWLKQHQIYLLRADWTLPNKAIENYLQKHQRYGIPFTAFHTLEQKDNPILLSEILTIDSLTALYPKNT